MPTVKNQPVPIRQTLVTTLFLLFSAVFVGCDRSAPTTNSTGNDSKAKNQETESEKCRKKLAAAITRVQPQELAFASQPERAINGLNAWISTCGAEELGEFTIGEETLKLVDSNPRATAKRFTANDASYLRDCLLLRDLSGAVWARNPAETNSVGKDAGRVAAMFNWLCRNVSLLPSGEERVVLNLFDVLLTGRGTSDDRVWIFVELLRQQHLHSVFLIQTNAPPADGDDSLATAAQLVVVGMENGSLLFDPTAGVAVVSGDDRKPVGMNDLKNHDRWKDSRPLIVAQLSAFAPRMLVLQNQLAAEDSAVLFEELTGGISEITSLLDLAVTLGDGLWTKDQVSIWPYPEEQTIAASSLSEKDKQSYSVLMQSFNAPFEREIYPTKSIEELTTVPEELSAEERKMFAEQRLMENFLRINQSSEEMFGKPSRRLLKTRIRQILGFTDTGVIQQLQQIRIASMQERIQVTVPEAAQKKLGLPRIMAIDFPEIIRKVNQSSTGDSLYWTAMCQIDRDQPGAAIITLMNYRRQYPDGKWKYPSLLNQAIALRAQSRIDDAKSVLAEADTEENPERPAVRAMLQELNAADQSGATSEQTVDDENAGGETTE